MSVVVADNILGCCHFLSCRLLTDCLIQSDLHKGFEASISKYILILVHKTQTKSTQLGGNRVRKDTHRAALWLRFNPSDWW